jgi:acetyltransferase-like isoleucine patch superfamily enzyme
MRLINILAKILFKNYSIPKQNYCCVLQENSKIYPQARICNASNIKENIIIGRNTYIVGILLVWGNCGKIEIGDYCFIGENTRIWSAINIKIGNRVQISDNCNIFDNNTHSITPHERHLEYIQNSTKGLHKLFNLNEKEVIIRDDAWICANSIILKGVTIGEGAVVAAGSVVLKNVPDFTVVGGNPAQQIKGVDIKQFSRPIK